MEHELTTSSTGKNEGVPYQTEQHCEWYRTIGTYRAVAVCLAYLPAADRDTPNRSGLFCCLPPPWRYVDW